MADLLALVSDVYCIFVTFPCGILGQVWYLIVLFPDLCHLYYFVNSLPLLTNVCNGLATDLFLLCFF